MSRLNQFIELIQGKGLVEVSVIKQTLVMSDSQFMSMLNTIRNNPYLELIEIKSGYRRPVSHVKLVKDDRVMATMTPLELHRQRKAQGLLSAPECYKWGA